MALEGAAPNAASAKRAGDRAWSVMTVNAADGDTITMDGEVVSAFADSDAAGVTAHVTGESGSDVTLEVVNIGDASSATADVSVHAIVET